MGYNGLDDPESAADRGGQDMGEHEPRGFWRNIAGGVAGLVAFGLLSLAVNYACSLTQGEESSEEYYASVAAGDCVSDTGYKADCDDQEAAYTVMDTFAYGAEALFPGDFQMAADADSHCPLDAVGYFTPTERTWAAGDRSILCFGDL